VILGVTQISTSDPVKIMTRNNISEVAYTVQTTVDALHNIPIDFKESNLLKQYPKHCAAILLLVAVSFYGLLFSNSQ
jgi:hypothetical protein